jgi:hypothetical protein
LEEKELISLAKNGRVSIRWHAIKSQIENVSAKPARQKMKKLHHCNNHTREHTRCFLKKNISASQKRCIDDCLVFVIQKTKAGKPKLLLREPTFALKTEEPLELLGKWLDYNISTSPYEKPIFAMRTKLYERKIHPDASATLAVLEYWNSLAKGLRLNDIKIPVHKIQHSKTIHMCQIIITGLIRLRSYDKKDVKKAIDNYVWILENSPWYGKNQYSFPRFFAKQQLFEDCITDNVKGNNRYVKKKLTKEGLLEGVVRLHKKTHGWEPTEDDVKMYKVWIKNGDIKTEKDFAGYVY